MKEQFVPLAIAQKLKERGFDEECFGWWFVDEEMLIIEKSKKSTSENIIQAPLWQQAFNWLESKHGIAINVTTFVSPEDGKPHIKMFYVHKHPLVVQPKTFECEVSNTIKTKSEVIEHALTLI